MKLSEVQAGRLLKKIGLSPQRPLYRAYQQDPERVAEWKKSVYPKIRKLAAEEGASIFFADEASIRTDHHAGTTWAPAGQTPVVITTGERKSVNMVSAISPRGELRFRVQEGKMNAGKFIFPEGSAGQCSRKGFPHRGRPSGAQGQEGQRVCGGEV